MTKPMQRWCFTLCLGAMLVVFSGCSNEGDQKKAVEQGVTEAGQEIGQKVGVDGSNSSGVDVGKSCPVDGPETLVSGPAGGGTVSSGERPQVAFVPSDEAGRTNGKAPDSPSATGFIGDWIKKNVFIRTEGVPGTNSGTDACGYIASKVLSETGLVDKPFSELGAANVIKRLGTQGWKVDSKTSTRLDDPTLKDLPAGSAILINNGKGNHVVVKTGNTDSRGNIMVYGNRSSRRGAFEHPLLKYGDSYKVIQVATPKK